MASKQALVRSINKSSEEMYDFTCSPCSKDGRNVEAINFCEECQEYFCIKCVEDHNRFAIMKAHKLLDKAGMMARKPQVLSLPTERCKEHHGNLIDTYCGNHDVVCCPTCVSVNHRSCIDITYLPKAAKGIQSSDEYRNIKSSLGNVNYNLEQTKKARKEDLDRLQQDRLTTLCEIQKFTRTMIKRLSDLEKTTTEEIHSKYTILENKLNEEINALDDILTSVNEGIKQIETYKGNNEAEIFVYVKDGKRTKDKALGLLNQIENKRGRKRINFTVDHTISTNINDLKSLGKFTAERVPADYNVSLHGNYNIKVNSDTKTCDILGSCQLDDGTIVIADRGNYKLKRLDKCYQVRDQCVLPGPPYDVCAVGSNEVAVLLQAMCKVQFVTIDGSMSLTKSFSTGNQSNGVGNMDSHLLVSSGDAVKMYSKTGTLLRTINEDSCGQKFSYPTHIAVTSDAKVHVADRLEGLIIIDAKFKNPSVFTHLSLKSPWAVCVGPDDQLYVGGSHNIFVVSGDGTRYTLLLSEKDGIKHPRSLCYDKFNCRLVVTFDISNDIKVYDLLKKQ